MTDFFEDDNIPDFTGDRVEESKVPDSFSATFNLNVSEFSGANPDIEAAFHNKAKELGLPYSVVKELDNAQLHPHHDASTLHPVFQRLLALDMHRVGMYKDDLLKLDAFVKAANPPKTEVWETDPLINMVRNPYVQQKEQAVDSVLSEYGQNADWDDRKAVERLLQIHTPYEEKAHNALYVQELIKKINTLKMRDIALMQELDAHVSGWKDFNDERLMTAIRDLNTQLPAEGKAPIDLTYFNVGRIRKGGIETTDPRQMFDIFGALTVSDALGTAVFGTKPSRVGPEGTAGMSEYLDEYALQLRGQTVGAQTLDTIYQAVPYIAEMLFTNGVVSTAKNGVKMGLKESAKYNFKQAAGQGLKGKAKAVGQTLADWLGSTAKRMPAYAPKLTAQAVQEAESTPIVYLDGEGVQQTMTENQADELGTAIARNILTQYAELATEQIGELIPEGAVISKVLPKFIKNGVARKFVERLASDPAKRSVLARAIKETNVVNGPLSELIEEEVNSFVNFLVSDVAFAAGMKALDTGVTEPLLDAEQTGVVLLSSLLMGESVRVLNTPFAAVKAAKTAKWIDNHRNMVAQLRETKLQGRSASETAHFVGMTHRDTKVYVDAESAEVLFQESPEMAQELGITENVIKNASANGRTIELSQNALIAAQARSPEFEQAGEKLLASAIPVGDISVKDAENFDVSEAAQERYEKIAERNNAIAVKLAQMRALGRSDLEVKNNMAILTAFASMVGRYDLEDEVEFLNKLAFGSMTEAEFFEELARLKAEGKVRDPKKGGALYQISPVYTGSAADYDTPSLHAVGTGEGAQVYGWGLYGSSSRNVAEWYAQKDFERKRQYDRYLAFIKYNGENAFDLLNELKEQYRNDEINREEYLKDAEPLMQLSESLKNIIKSEKVIQDPKKRLIQYIEKIRTQSGDSSFYAELLNSLDKIDFNQIHKIDAIKRNLYEQTFWPDKQEDLLDWEGKLTQAQVEKIIAQMDKDPRFEKEDYEKAKAERGHYSDVQPDTYRVWEEDEEDDMKVGHSFSRGWLEQFTDPEKEWASIEHLYDAFERALGSPKAASEFLYAAGIDGVTYVGDSSGVRNYVAFSDKDIRIDEHIQFQSGTVRRGATLFLNNMEAMIVLFKGQNNVSTLTHEIAHYLYESVKALVQTRLDSGMDVDSGLIADIAALEKWAKKQGGDFRENIAKGFEQYVMEGVAPEDGLRGVFASMSRLLRMVYRYAESLGVQIDNDVRRVFNNWLSVDDTVEEESLLKRIGLELDESLGDLPQKDKNAFRKLIDNAKAQSKEKLLKSKNEQLKTLKKQWTEEAKALIPDNPAVAVQQDIDTNGKLSSSFVDEVSGDKETSKALRKKGLAARANSKGKRQHPADLASKYGFASAEDMLLQLLDAPTVQQFIQQYVDQQTVEFEKEFQMSEESITTELNMQAWDRILDYLAQKGGREGYNSRKNAMNAHIIMGEIYDMSVNDILKGGKQLTDAKENVNDLAKAVGTGDYAQAFDIMLNLRTNLEIMKYKAAAANEIRKGVGTLLKGVRAKDKTIFSDHRDALRNLANLYGVSKVKPKKPGMTLGALFKSINEERKDAGLPDIQVPDFMLSAEVKLKDMTFANFRDFARVVAFVYGDGRAIVDANHNSFMERVKNTSAKLMGELNTQKEKYKDGGIGQTWRILVNQGTKLRNIFEAAGGWGADSEFMKLYNRTLLTAANEHDQLQDAAKRPIVEAFRTLEKTTKKIDFSDLPEFPQDVKLRGYDKWDTRKLIAACLNMGTAKNRQRLRNGFGWTDKDLKNIAAKLTKEQWDCLQIIWDSIGNGTLRDRWAQTYREEFYSDPVQEEAVPFMVEKDGQSFEVRGGYYPIEYLYHKHESTNDKVSSERTYLPEHKTASFNHERVAKSSDPLRLSLDLPYRHIYEVSHYVAYTPAMKELFKIVKHSAFAEKFKRTQGFERYKALMTLLRYVANPTEAMSSDLDTLESKARAMMASMALYGSPSVALSQLTSFSVGLEELKGYYAEAAVECLTNWKDVQESVFALSSFMRNRANTKDIDLRSRIETFENPAGKALAKAQDLGFMVPRQIDLVVTMPVWLASYNKAMAEGKTQRESVALADEFVAKTQGGSRLIDMSTVQTHKLGRATTLFFSATSAFSTHASRIFNRAIRGKMTTGQVAWATVNIVVPAVSMAFLRSFMAGDDDKAKNAFWREIINAPFQGIPLVRDVADFLTRGFTGGYTADALEYGPLTPVNRLLSDTVGAFKRFDEEGVSGAAYNFAKAAGAYFRIPVLHAYETTKRVWDRYAE
jgi:hypothetical protein